MRHKALNRAMPIVRERCVGRELRTYLEYHGRIALRLRPEIGLAGDFTEMQSPVPVTSPRLVNSILVVRTTYVVESAI